MINSYKQPQSTITQYLNITKSSTGDHINALVVGPQYLLAMRDGRALVTKEFVTGGNSIPFDYIIEGKTKSLQPLTHTVASKYTKLYGDNLEIIEGTVADMVMVDINSPRELKTGSGLLSGPTANLVSTLSGRSVRVGDLITATSGTTTKHAKVVLLKNAFSDPSVTAATNADASNFPTHTGSSTHISAPVATDVVAATVTTINATDKAADTFFAGGSTYGGKLGEIFTITCTAAGKYKAGEEPAFSVVSSGIGTNITALASTYSDDGTDSTLTLTLTGAYEDVVITIKHAGLLADTVALGDVFAVGYNPVVGGSASTAITASHKSATEQYSGTTDNFYIIKVKKGGSTTAVGTADGVEFVVYDAQGVDTTTEITMVGTDLTVNIGSKNVKITIKPADSAGDFITGDKFLVEVKAAAVVSGAYDTFVVDQPLFDPSITVVTDKFDVTISTSYTGEITAANTATGSSPAFTSAADSITTVAGLGSKKSDGTFVAFTTARGTLSASWKAVQLPKAVENATLVYKVSKDLGEIDADNDLAYGVQAALSGSQGKEVYFLRTAGEEPEDYTKALAKIESADHFYAIAGLCTDLPSQKVLLNHVEAMSTPSVKNFRRAYVGTDSPGAYTALGAREDGSWRTATTFANSLKLEEVPGDAVNFDVADIQPGDIVKFRSRAESYKVLDRLSGTELLLETAPAAPITVAESIEIIKPDTARNQAIYVASRSNTLSSRRVVNVWCDGGTIRTPKGIHGVSSKYIACEVAGLRSAMLPQQGLTTTEIKTISDAPTMYTLFSAADLNYAASNGTMVVTQDALSGAAYVRHQLTTETDLGALAWEDNPGVIVDVLSYRIKDSFHNFIGKKNVTAQTIAAISNELDRIMREATLSELALQDFGPIIIGYKDAKGKEGAVTVQVGDTADTIDTYVKVLVPLPLNYLNHYIEADVTLSL